MRELKGRGEEGIGVVKMYSSIRTKKEDSLRKRHSVTKKVIHSLSLIQVNNFHLTSETDWK